jgi:hypothetical protein
MAGLVPAIHATAGRGKGASRRPPIAKRPLISRHRRPIGALVFDYRETLCGHRTREHKPCFTGLK